MQMYGLTMQGANSYLSKYDTIMTLSFNYFLIFINQLADLVYRSI